MEKLSSALTPGSHFIHVQVPPPQYGSVHTLHHHVSLALLRAVS